MVHAICFVLLTIFCLNVKSNEPILRGNNHLFDLDLYQDVLDPELCEEQLDYINLEENRLLALQFLDSGYRTPRGILTGSLNDMGNYYQCLDIHEELDTNSIDGKYCMMKLSLHEDEDARSSVLSRLIATENINIRLEQYIDKLNLLNEALNLKKGLEMIILGNTFNDEPTNSTSLSNLELGVAICIPKTCTSREALDRLPFNFTNLLGLRMEEDFCRLPNDKQWVPADYTAVIILSIIGLLTLLSTFYDLYQTKILEKGPKEVNKNHQIFSVYTNCRRLLTFKSSPGTLECVDGIRSIAIMWMVIGHTFSLPASSNLLANPLELISYIKRLSSLWLSSAPITVDTFFALSGILLIYTTAGKLTSMKLVKNIHLFYLHRLLRMFPMLALGVLLEASIINHVTDGPYLESRVLMADACRSNWWTTLLYVQNFVRKDNMCLPHSWYLAIDMQIHIISPIVLFWVLKSRKSAWISLSGALMLVLAGATTYNFINDFPATSQAPGRQDEMYKYLRHYYVHTLPRASPFFVGMIFGYILHTLRGKKLNLLKMQVALLWVCTTFLLLAVIYCHYPIYWDEWADYRVATSIINSFQRPVWATGICLMIFVCVHGYGGPINWFLSLTLWKLPARISYAVYILHYSVISVTMTMALQPYYFTTNFLFFNFLAYYCLSSIVALLATLLIDAPFSTIIKLAIGGGAKRPEKLRTVPEVTEDIKKFQEQT